jgi:hypothetical protein
VIRSVANHLHDISKIDKDLALKTLIRWEKENKQKDVLEFEYLKRHSLRTLIKNGDKETLKYLGYKSEINIELKNFKIKNDKVKIGEALEFSFEIINKNKKENIIQSLENLAEDLIIDYIIYFNNKDNNNLKSKKVFKLKEIKINNDKKILISKKHLFRFMTTRKLYSGAHKIILQINGKNYLEKSFDLYE